jgi:hypothetical protein
MTLVFFDGPRTVLMLDDVAGATGCAADRFSSVAEIKCLIHGGPIMYRRTWAATIEGQFPRKLAPWLLLLRLRRWQSEDRRE